MLISIFVPTFASLPTPLVVPTESAILIQKKLLELEKRRAEKFAGGTAHQELSRLVVLAKDVLLIERCNSLLGISSMISSFLLPCAIPALQTPASETFVRGGCEECASHPFRQYVSITSSGAVLKQNDHYQKPISGNVKCGTALQLTMEHPLQCSFLVNHYNSKQEGFGAITFKNKDGIITLKQTEKSTDSHNYPWLTFNNHARQTPAAVDWYQQCVNPQAKYDHDNKHHCQHHFIIALVPSTSRIATNEMFIWSASNGDFHGQYQIPSHMTLLAYENTKRSLFSTIGVDGFLWWMNNKKWSLERLDRRNIWEVVLKNQSAEAVWYNISPNAQWMLERLGTTGVNTAFRKTFCGNSKLAIPDALHEKMLFHKQSTLWHVTTALWLNKLFDDINYSHSLIHMDSQSALRYHNLKNWLAKSNMTLAKGLQARIHERTETVKISDKKSPEKTGKKRKDY